MTLCVRRNPGAAARPSVAAAAALACSLTAAPARGDQDLDILYINRCAGNCVVQQGSDSAITNRSSILNVGTATLTAFPFGDAVFDATVTCIRSVFAPYDVIVTTVDPGAVLHRELMLAGTPQQIGHPSVSGVAPFNGSPLANAIAFAFAALIGEDADSLCYNAGHQLGHLYGLDHEFYCPDLLTYLTCAGTKTFADFDAPCGESGPRQCVSGAATQNSAVVLATVAGQEEILFRNGFEEAGPVFGELFAAGLVEPLVCGAATPR